MNNKNVYAYVPEKRGCFGSFLIAGTTHATNGYKIKRTCSDITVLEYVVSGSGTILLPDGTYKTVEAGDVFYIPRKTDHYYFSNDEYGQWVKIYVNFGGDVFNDFIKGFGLGDRYIYPGLDISEEIRECISIVKSKSTATEIKCSAAIFNIVKKMYYRVYNDKNENVSDADVLKKYIDKNYSGKADIKTLAALIGKSESQTIRIFKKNFKTTPHQYILEKKLIMAKILLKNSELPVKSVSQKLNFADEFYFSNTFKNRYGMSPNNYKNQKKWDEK